ncbi:MAG: 4-vinyl reductase [Polyangiaceae bacterium]|nr:4-vinyl reductase [Polyangiaceae bacterium]
MSARGPVAPVEHERSIVTLGGGRLVMHCHHYNAFLQRTVEEGLGERAAALLTAAAMETARRVLGGLEDEAPSGSPRACIERAAALLGENGFGRVDAAGLGERGGAAIMERSHYALGWLAKCGRRASPGCFFAAGWLAGAVAVAGRLAPERVVGRETECLAAGAERCAFVVEVW